MRDQTSDSSAGVPNELKFPNRLGQVLISLRFILRAGL